MLGVVTGAQAGKVTVHTTVGRGLNADELTRMAMAKILFVGPDVPPAIRDQAEAYRTRIEEVLRHYLAQAQRSRDTTVCNILEEAGESRAAALIRSL